MVRSGSSSPTWTISLMISFTLSEFLVVSLSRRLENPTTKTIFVSSTFSRSTVWRGRNRGPLPVWVRNVQAWPFRAALYRST
ncbi:hypothetical protein EDB83DRAFT_2340403 [Lactarius deliciosus]|nr:hypothetical protein EDB83DRAFT_2340403 [Lactarius deliciosus]